MKEKRKEKRRKKKEITLEDQQVINIFP